MGFLELLLIAVGLSMDAFAVAVTNGLCCKKMKTGWVIGTGLCFGGFQGLMPTIGFFLGKSFEKYITAFDHYIALVLLGFIGIKMIVGAIKGAEDEQPPSELTLTLLLVQGIATSIDALAVGVGFAALPDINIAFAAISIFATTLLFSVAGIFIGKKFGNKLNNKAQLLGGFILVGIGVKIFVEHMWF